MAAIEETALDTEDGWFEYHAQERADQFASAVSTSNKADEMEFGFGSILRVPRVEQLLADQQFEGHASSSTSIRASDLIDTYAEMSKAKSFEREYQSIIAQDDQAGRDTTKTARTSYNVRKNRDEQVLPQDSSRVVLEANKFAGSDYINASYIDGWRRPKAFIATQAPLPSTVGDFWRMVWEGQSSVIVMLTEGSDEGGRQLCFPYWPKSKETSIKCGGVHVELVSFQSLSPSIDLRRCLVTPLRADADQATDKGEAQSLLITQFCVHGWNSGSPMPPTDAVIDLAERVRHQMESARMHGCGTGPPIVHCELGVAQTSVFLATYISAHRLVDVGTIDMAATVRHMRAQRLEMVPTAAHYSFIYELLVDYYQRRTAAADRGRSSLLSADLSLSREEKVQLWALGEDSNTDIDVEDVLDVLRRL